MGDIDDVKSKINIVDLISEKVSLKRAGRNFKGLCPFHNEKTPSFMVSPERGIWHCFGCGKGGSAIDFVMEYEHVDFGEALEGLADRAGIKLEFDQSDSPAAKLKKQIFEINHITREFYQYLLLKHKLGQKARLYLEKRLIKEPTIKTFGLGYSPNSWDGLLKYLHKKGYQNKLIEQAGLIIPSSRGGYDRFRGRLMFPIHDYRGNVIGFSGRVLDREVKEAKYINTADTLVYNKSESLYGINIAKENIQKTREVVLMEGEFDVISSFQEGISNAVAIKGSALTEGHINLLKRFAEKLIFALDSDSAGDAASRRGINLAEKSGLELRVVEMPAGKDPDEAIRENPYEFKKSIKQAIPIYDYFINSALHRFGNITAFGKKQISDELIPFLNEIENPVVQSHYIKNIAQVLNTSEEVVVEAMRRAPKNLDVISHKKTGLDERITYKTRSEKLEIFVLALVLQGRTKDFLEELKEHVNFEELDHPGIKQIFVHLTNFINQNNTFFITDFVPKLPKELLPVFDEAYLTDTSLFIENDELLAREWLKALKELKKDKLKRKIKNITQKVDLDQNQDDAQQQNLRDELRASIKKLSDLEKSSTI